MTKGQKNWLAAGIILAVSLTLFAIGKFFIDRDLDAFFNR